MKIPPSSIRGYKNLNFKSVPENLIKKIIDLRLIQKRELKKHILGSFYKEDIIKKSLELGRKERRKHFNKLKLRIPKLTKIMSNSQIDVSKWFYSYKGLLEFPFRKVKINECDDFIILRYSNFVKTSFRDFKVHLPKRFQINPEFLYFFGLWCGDRAGGKRFGICNKNPNIIKFTEDFLKKENQRVEKILYISKKLTAPKIKYDKKFILNHDIKGWVLSIHSYNGVLASFFYYLLKNLEKFLTLTKHKEAFFAGLFDAEGNVSLYNKSFRWACKNKKLVEIYSLFLKEIGLYDRYDGECLISYNVKGFHNKILPFLKHSDKINKTKFLFSGKGFLPKEYKEVLSYIKESPKENAKEISKALKKSKVYSELKLLNDFGFISNKGYPYRFEITSKGLKSLGD